MQIEEMKPSAREHVQNMIVASDGMEDAFEKVIIENLKSWKRT